MSYTLLTTEELQSLAPELATTPSIVKNNEDFWHVKFKRGTVNEEKRDLLAYLLGKDICNIAEVKLLSDTEHAEIKTLLNLDVDSTSQNTFLVRLGGSYKLNTLPNKALETAVATELVYSVWIRRRDTHSMNRIYLEGIPVFFDHQTAFLGEPGDAHSTMFFRNSLDAGHPAFWRAKLIPSTEKMYTLKARNVPEIQKAWHYIYDKDKFLEEVKNSVVLVSKIGEIDLTLIIKAAGFNDVEVEAIDNFLKVNLITLESDVKQMMDILFRP